jgi:hypothetical protein
MNPSYHSDSVRTSTEVEAAASNYAPSVPMPVYRELAAELQATKAMVDALSNQNQHLTRQNQLLRQEIHRAVQVTLQLGQFAGVAQPADAELTVPAPIPPHPALAAEPPRRAQGHPPKHTASERPRMASPMPKAMALVPKFFTEQSGEQRRYALESTGPKDMSGLWLVLSIVLIIFTAFGAGFLIMRPLLSDR